MSPVAAEPIVPIRRPHPRRRCPRTCRVAVITGLLALSSATTVAAQARSATSPPEIGDVDLRGVQSVPEEQLQLVLSTKSTYCRLPFLRPVCYFVRTPFLVRHHYLDPGELERDMVRLRGVYWQRGFRETSIDTVVTRGRHGLQIAFVISEGPPTLVDTVMVEQVGELLPSDEILRVVRLERGRPLDLASLDTGLIALRNKLWDAGHADATLEPEIRVDDRQRRANVRLVVDPRWPTRVGSIEIEGNERLSDDALKSALTFRPGVAFRRRDVVESQKYLYQSLGVATATIIGPPTGDSLKDVRVRVRENPSRRIALSIGFNTIEFVQLGARAGVYTLAGGRWQAELRGAVGNVLARQLEGAGPFADVPTVAEGDAVVQDFTRPTWQGSAELTRLWAGSPRNRLAIGAYSHQRLEPSVFIERGSGGFVAFTRELAQRAPLTVGYRLERAALAAPDVYFCQSYGQCSASVVAALRDPRRLASVTLNWWLDRTNNAVAPSRGYTLRADADHASAATGSEFKHNRVAAEAATYLKLGRAVLATRARAGWVRSPESSADATRVAALHPRALFFAGGVESVRGYHENQLGPRVLRVRSDDLIASGCTPESVADASCDPAAAPAAVFSPRPVGGTTLLEGTAEVRLPLGGKIGGVIFADAARLTTESDVKGAGAVTPGVGLRYESNVGTLRLDVGWRPWRTEQLPVVVATRDASGVERVTRLATDRAWTEGDAERGLLRRVTLHFVLGHTF